MPSSFFRACLYKSIRIIYIINTIIVKYLLLTRCFTYFISSHLFPFCMVPSFLQMRKHRLKVGESFASKDSVDSETRFGIQIGLILKPLHFSMLTSRYNASTFCSSLYVSLTSSNRLWTIIKFSFSSVPQSIAQGRACN